MNNPSADSAFEAWWEKENPPTELELCDRDRELIQSRKEADRKLWQAATAAALASRISGPSDEEVQKLYYETADRCCGTCGEKARSSQSTVACMWGVRLFRDNLRITAPDMSKNPENIDTSKEHVEGSDISLEEHPCMTGDCPHLIQIECDETLKAFKTAPTLTWDMMEKLLPSEDEVRDWQAKHYAEWGYDSILGMYEWLREQIKRKCDGQR